MGFSTATSTSTFTLSVTTFSRLASVTNTLSGKVTRPVLPFGPSSTRPEKPYLTDMRPGSIWLSRAVLFISPSRITTCPTTQSLVGAYWTLSGESTVASGMLGSQGAHSEPKVNTRPHPLHGSPKPKRTLASRPQDPADGSTRFLCRRRQGDQDCRDGLAE